MNELLLSGTVVAAFLGGVVALLAPCCISVMLPAYFATSFHRRTQIAAMTLVFAAGVATVILPLGLGASAISRLLVGQHRVVFAVGGLLMVVAGVAVVAGRKLVLPMPGRQGAGGRGVGSVYGLGVFSGAASACCAPVLAGVVALGGAAGSFAIAVTIGMAYVVGMVAPLAVLALVWDKRNWGRARIFGDWGITLRVGAFRRRVPGPALLSGGMLTVMGLLTVAFALRGPTMTLSGWQLRLTARLGHVSSIVQRALDWLPGWAGLLLLLAAVLLYVRFARQHRADSPPHLFTPQETLPAGEADDPAVATGSEADAAPALVAPSGTSEGNR